MNDKLSIKHLIYVSVIVLSLFLTSCGAWDDDDDDDVFAAPGSEAPAQGSAEDEPNIVEVAIENGNFTTLVAAVTAAGLDDDLQSEGPFTVFAPTDAAFANLPEGTVEFLIDPANQAALIDILTYHVYPAEVFAADAIALDGERVEMLNGTNLAIDVVDGAVILNLGATGEAMVTATDIVASNGVIHVIDAVLLPEDGQNEPEESNSDIVDTAIASGDFTILVTALEAAGLVEALRGPGPFTVFAPTDDAFADLPEGTIEYLIDPANQQELIDILTYHVFAGEVPAADAIALAGSDVDMLNGARLSIDVADGAVILNSGGAGEARVTVIDIYASNGIIHVIDTVLDPNDAH